MRLEKHFLKKRFKQYIRGSRTSNAPMHPQHKKGILTKILQCKIINCEQNIPNLTIVPSKLN